MVIYFLDTEFNGFGGALISLALACEDGASLYLIMPEPEAVEAWVAEHVMPVLLQVPPDVQPVRCASMGDASAHIADFLRRDPHPTIIADWPDDIRYFCAAITKGPGVMISLKRLTFEMLRVQAYPTRLEGAVQHNAWWDAMALRHLSSA